jgi:hypothetical protein
MHGMGASIDVLNPIIVGKVLLHVFKSSFWEINFDKDESGFINT